ncbi:cyclic-phosphate processing receiver domain-containing protein [Cesiribacter andamanensis]|uniref:Cyclic-phosphate processing Receiver domain-containing protein n=1 Tax=Cesiribacter andamanensis AMV16 TaxID=1279009 RepID=M7NHY2_9BACT|nr:cyclic-phosphate processing receiver domain-containing protein [Cesiribacter andamanensis]EMR01425.1 hypothetical protein ADICEAN_03459 [Cesiribacter andamanensis AMV16]
MTNYKLYIDDIRTPKTSGWVVVRSFDEFVYTIKRKGIPSEISFDHDLGWDYINNQEMKSGYDCAKWLVENDILIQNFNVHSANPVGAKNISCLLENFIRFKEKYEYA